MEIFMSQFKDFKDDFFSYIESQDLTVSAFKALHYERNQNQPAQQLYVDMLTGGYDMAADGSSAFHRIGSGNENNTKFTRDDGREYVFKYVGTALSGQFQMVEDDTNRGTYNFGNKETYGSELEATFHSLQDIAPWILWGNSKVDSQNWTWAGRFAFVIESIPGKVREWIETKSEWLPGKVNKGSMLDDTLSGSAAEEEFRGSVGNDTADYSSSTSAVAASLQNGKGYEGFASLDTYRSIENLTGSGWGDVLVGNNGDNTLLGGEGRDYLKGLKGNDILDGGSQGNTLFGGAGDDVLFVRETETIVRGGSGTDTIISTLGRLFIGGHDRFSSVEIFQLTEHTIEAEYALVLHGSSRAETLLGNRFDNELYGGAGQDVLDGGLGYDTLQGGRGNDTYVFGQAWGTGVISEESGSDTLHFTHHNLDDLRITRDTGVNGNHLNIYDKGSSDLVFVWNQFSSQSNLMVDKLVTKDAEINLRGGLPLTGTDSDDSLAGTNFDDEINGEGGDDYIWARGGVDIVVGGAGNDILMGAGGDDSFIFRPGFGHDQIYEEGASPGEVDSSGDIIEFYDIGFSSVRKFDDFQGRTTIYVLDSAREISDSIFIHSQSFNYGEGLLVELVSFDGGTPMAIGALIDFA